MHRLSERDHIRIQPVERVRWHEADLVDQRALVAGNLDDEIGWGKRCDRALGKIERKRVLAPLQRDSGKPRRCENLAVPIAFSNGDGNFVCASKMLDVNASAIVQFALDRQINLLADAGRFAGNSENRKRLPRICCIAPPRFVAIPLLGIERLPGKRECQIRSAYKLWVGGDHLLYMPGIPEPVFEARIAQYLGPQPVIDGVPDRLKERAEYRLRYGVRRRLSRIHGNSYAIGLRPAGRNVLSESACKCCKQEGAKFLTHC